MLEYDLLVQKRMLYQMPTPPGLIRLSSSIETDNIVNGPGLRTVIWTQGCHMACPGCQNPETWDENAGFMRSTALIKNLLMQIKGQNGLTFCGGEPLLQAGPCLDIARWVKRRTDWTIWSFTGFVYEDLPREGVVWDFVRTLDVLIDGPYVEAERDMGCKWRGSRNQRILHLRNGEIAAIE